MSDDKRRLGMNPYTGLPLKYVPGQHHAAKIKRLEARVEALEKTVETLRELVCYPNHGLVSR